MAATKTFTVDNAGDPEPIVVSSYCMKVVVYEDGHADTTAFILHVPNIDSPGVTMPAGSRAEIARGWRYEPGYENNSDPLKKQLSIAGYIETVTGSVTFAQEEGWL